MKAIVETEEDHLPPRTLDAATTSREGNALVNVSIRRKAKRPVSVCKKCMMIAEARVSVATLPELTT